MFQVRELYTKCAVECITHKQEFKECMQLIHFQSQIKLVEGIQSALKVVNSALQGVSPVKPLHTTPNKYNLHNIILTNDVGENFMKTIRVHLLMFLRQIQNANTETSIISDVSHDGVNDQENTSGNRYKLKEVGSIKNGLFKR